MVVREILTEKATFKQRCGRDEEGSSLGMLSFEEERRDEVGEEGHRRCRFAGTASIRSAAFQLGSVNGRPEDG